VALEFSFCATDLITVDSPVSSPAGIVYSTNPHKAEAINGRTYFVKGPQLEVVFAELSGCLLAAALGVPVPAVALCAADTEKFAGSERVEQAFRDASVPLKKPEKIANIQDLYNIIVIDSWLGNTDRNLGNVLAVVSGERLILVMIDFEKSVALRPLPRIQSALIEPRSLWPTAELGEYARAMKPLYPPPAAIQAVGAMNEERCRRTLQPLLDCIGNVPWANDTVGALASRAGNIGKIVEAVWRSI
jgi:hypothetical protein